MVDELKRKPSVWKGKHLSLEGREALVNSVLTRLMLYFFSFFKPAKGVIKESVAIQRRFLWSGGVE